MEGDPSASPPLSGTPALVVAGLRKRFGATQALAGVSFAVQRGTIHGLVGENGAGKSTLIKCLAGVHQPDAGTILLEGHTRRIEGPRAAGALGISVVHQELSLVPFFDAAENALLGEPYPKTRFGLVDRQAMRRIVRAALRDIAPDLPLDRPAKRLTVGERQIVEIARALLGQARLIVMDEPTAALGAAEADRLHAIMRRLAATGAAVLYVSHRLDDILALCTTVTVLRDGASVFEGPAASLDQAAIVAQMSGRPRPTAPPEPARRSDRAGSMDAPAALTLAGLVLRSGTAAIDLTLRRGEIMGLYGLLGAGRSRLLKTLWGAHRPVAGAMSVSGRPLALGSIRAALAAGLAFVPEERRTEGLMLGLSVAANISLPRLSAFRALSWLPWPSRRREADHAGAVARRLSIRIASVQQPVGGLSGGNQQKVLVGRWLRQPPAVLLLDEPTRGVDVRAKAELHAALRGLAAEGTAILFATSDLDELLTLGDRIGLMRQGALVGTLETREATPAIVLSRLFGTAAGTAEP